MVKPATAAAKATAKLHAAEHPPATHLHLPQTKVPLLHPYLLHLPQTKVPLLQTHLHLLHLHLHLHLPQPQPVRMTMMRQAMKTTAQAMKTRAQRMSVGRRNARGARRLTQRGRPRRRTGAQPRITMMRVDASLYLLELFTTVTSQSVPTAKKIMRPVLWHTSARVSSSPHTSCTYHARKN